MNMGTETLTNVDVLHYLLSLEADKMTGTIRSKGVCPSCGGKFTEIKKLGFVCATCKTAPTRYYLDFFHKSKRIRIFTDKQGQVLDSYQRAVNLLAHINFEIKSHTFDPSHYVKSEQEKFYVSTWIDAYLTEKMPSIAPSWQHTYKRMGLLINDYFNAKDIRDIIKLDVKNYKAHLEKMGLGEKTLKNHMDYFRAFLRYTFDELQIPFSLKFPEIEVTKKTITWFDSGDQGYIFSLVPMDDKPIIAFLTLHGCRPSESRALKCKDIDLKKNVITISCTWSGRKHLRPKRKGRGSEPVVIPIHPEMLDFLEKRVKTNFPESFVFINMRTGLYYSDSALGRIWDNVRKKAGIPKSVRLYDFTRHSFGSQLINSGSSLLAVSKLLGHTTTKTTEIYTHSNIEKLRCDISKITLNNVTNLSLGKKTVEK